MMWGDGMGWGMGWMWGFWILLILGIVLFGAYVMLQENGLLLNNWMTVHEFFHDGRHALGFPCH